MKHYPMICHFCEECLALLKTRRVPIDPTAFGQHVRYWRMVHGWTPEELARLGRKVQKILQTPGRPITPAWIRMVENQPTALVTSLRRTHIEALSIALNVPAESLCAPGHASGQGLTLTDILRWTEHCQNPSDHVSPMHD